MIQAFAGWSMPRLLSITKSARVLHVSSPASFSPTSSQHAWVLHGRLVASTSITTTSLIRIPGERKPIKTRERETVRVRALSPHDYIPYHPAYTFIPQPYVQILVLPRTSSKLMSAITFQELPSQAALASALQARRRAVREKNALLRASGATVDDDTDLKRYHDTLLFEDDDELS